MDKNKPKFRLFSIQVIKKLSATFVVESRYRSGLLRYMELQRPVLQASTMRLS